MTVRHAVLSIGALVVLGVGVYLLVEVRAQPVEPTATAAPPPAHPAPTPAPTPPPAQAARPSVPPPAVPAAPPSTPSWLPAHPTPGPSIAAADSVPAPSDLDLSAPKLEAVMAEANKAYDRGDFDEAKTVAARLLAREPNNIRMLRIMVSASCIDGDTATAQSSYIKLPPGDQAQMRTRCARYGVSFPDAP